MLYGKCVNQLVVVDAIYIGRTSPDMFGIHMNNVFSKSWVNVNRFIFEKFLSSRVY